MKIDKSTIEKIAHLSRLHFNEKDEAEMLESMNNIIEWVDKLSELNTDSVKPLTHMSEEVSVLRQDIAIHTLTHAQALHNAPKKDSNYIRVPKVIE